MTSKMQSTVQVIPFLLVVVGLVQIVTGSTVFHPLMSDSRRIRVNGSLTDELRLDYSRRKYMCPFAIGSPANITYTVFFANICGFSIGSQSCCTNFELDEIVPALITKYTQNLDQGCEDIATKAICSQCLPSAINYAEYIQQTGTFYFRMCRDQCATLFHKCKSHTGNYTDSNLNYQDFCVHPKGVLYYPPEIKLRFHNYSFPGNFTGLDKPCWSGTYVHVPALIMSALTVVLALMLY